MGAVSEITSFLTSRRARLSPEEVGIPRYEGVRRVPGLRREEVAYLAGVSADYYARLERGRLADASREVLEAVSRVLQLDDDERRYLLDLVRAAQSRPDDGTGRERTRVRAGVRRVLDSIAAPALVQNARLDRLAFNRAGRLVHSLPADGS